MSSQDHEKPGGKSGRKKQKRSKKPDRAESPLPDQQQAAKELVDAAIALAEASPAEAATADSPSADTTPVEASPAAVATADTSPAEPAPAVEAPPVAEAAAPMEAPATAAAAPESTSPVGLQTIATAYRDYTRKSLEDTQSYVEKLSGARSLDKAVEVQAEFAKQAYETFVADCWKIRGLYSELFKQTLRFPKSPPGGASR